MPPIEFRYVLTQEGYAAGIRSCHEWPLQSPHCTRVVDGQPCDRRDIFYDSERNLTFCARHMRETVGAKAFNVEPVLPQKAPPPEAHYHVVIQIDDLGGGDVQYSPKLASREAAEAWREGWLACRALARSIIRTSEVDGDQGEELLGMIENMAPVIVTALSKCQVCANPDGALTEVERLSALTEAQLDERRRGPNPCTCGQPRGAGGQCSYWESPCPYRA